MEQERVTLPEHMSFTLLNSGFVFLDLSLSVWCFVDRCLSIFFLAIVLSILLRFTGSDSGAYPVRGGALKKIAPSEGRRENFWGISCEK